ncbi:MAG TPA: class I SAM-dependent methyltransferase [Parvularculaceae bacterium]|nr:class I SAM-dependent methyltransferase [Parvularculaceae bacterium]
MPMDAPSSADLDEKYWRELREKSAFAGITLDESISFADFALYGDRIAGRQMDMYRRVGGRPFGEASILDIGCGVGRLLKPFSMHFARAVGVDMNERILDAARDYIGDRANVELVKNDGRTVPFPDNSFDYVFCGGVLQHVPDIDVIMGYFREGLRVLKPGGVLNYSVMVWMKSRKGGIEGDRVGAKIVASDLEALLNDTGHLLTAIFSDPQDPNPHFQIMLRKSAPFAAALRSIKRRISPFEITPSSVTPMKVRTGTFEDLPSYTKLRAQWASGKRKPVTFFSRPD